MAEYTRTTPKIDWGVDVVSSTHMNAIGENLSMLYQGGAVSAAALNAATGTAEGGSQVLTFPNSTENVFSLTIAGSPRQVWVSLVDSTDRKAGNVVHLVVDDGVSIIWKGYGTAAGNNKQLRLPDIITYYLMTPENTGATIVYNGTYWVVSSHVIYSTETP